MRTVKRILVPVDFTDFSQRAADYAAMLARKFRSDILLVHVIEQLTYDVTDTIRVVDHSTALRAIADRLIEQLCRRLRRKRVGVQAAVLRGNVSIKIIEEARKRRSDLIVMGTHGRTGLEHVVLGSVAERVVRLAPCPVLTVGSGRSPKHRKPLPVI